jgi:hypothetical protein
LSLGLHNRQSDVERFIKVMKRVLEINWEETLRNFLCQHKINLKNMVF